MKLPKSIWSGTFNIAGVELKCHVLDDGRRIIEEESMAAFIRALAGDSGGIVVGDLEELAKWRAGSGGY